MAEILGTKTDDKITGTAGDDVIKGGAGKDNLVGDTPGEVTFKTELLEIAEDRDVTVTFDSEGAGYRNSLGVYKVDKETGEIEAVDVMWDNASLQGSGGSLIGGESTYTFPVEAGEQIGFFLIGNGFSQNNFNNMKDGEFSFVNADGKPANIDESGLQLVHTSDSGAVTNLNGNVYHTAGYGDRAKLNPDGIEHTVGVKQNDEGSIQIGFEDLFGGGDNDFDDAVFTVDIGKASVEVLNEHFKTGGSDAVETVSVSEASQFSAESGNDKIFGGADADKIDGMHGNDLLAGGGAGAEWQLVDGKWTYDASAIASGGEAVAMDVSDDQIEGGSGDDVLLGGGGNDEMSGGAGADILNAGDGNDVVSGGDGNDTLNLEDGNDLAKGGAGDDIINAGAGDDVAYGGDGDDKLRGGDGDDQLYGGAGQDELHGGVGSDMLDGGAGNDKLFGGAGDDKLSGGDGDDHLDGGAGNDKLEGGDGKDMLKGGAGDDHLSGGSGDDKLVGGSGSDTIEGGAGNDHMWGGNWSGDKSTDTFVVSAGGGKDMVHDFETEHDVIDLSSYGLEFSDLAGLMQDKGWATEIDLSGLKGAESGDKLILKSVDADDLDESNFIL